MAVTATFSPAAGILTAIGDSANNTITLSRNAAGNLLLNGGAVSIVGGKATVANTARSVGTAGATLWVWRATTSSDSTNRTALCRPPICSVGAATTRSPAVRVPISCSVRPGTMCCPAKGATTCCSAAMATTR